jgi:lipopolysaccharide biosynthesis glycosyltransferase
MTAKDLNDCAVALCCDRNYFHLALFTIRQLDFHNPHRRFDFIIATRDDLEIPDWAKPMGVSIHRLGDLPDTAEVGRYRGSVAPLYRIMLARELGDRYRRILYFDCDMFIEGGDVNRLMEVDLGPHPIGAVLDAPVLYEANFRAREFQKLGWPAAPYCNTGLQLIDTKAFVAQEVERRSFEVCNLHPEAIVYTDQSLTNIALRGKFAQLAPCWNWQNNYRLPLVTINYPVFFRHFIGPNKPDRRTESVLDVRFNQAYREFLTNFMPDLLPKLAPVRDTAPLPFAESALIVLRHHLSRNIVAETLKRYSDPYVAIY